MKFYIETEISEGKIIQRLNSTGVGDSPIKALRHPTLGVIEWIYDTNERGIKEALIKLGWKPPEEDA